MADGERTVDDVLADLKAMKKELKVSAVHTRRGDQTSDCTCTDLLSTPAETTTTCTGGARGAWQWVPAASLCVCAPTKCAIRVAREC